MSKMKKLKRATNRVDVQVILLSVIVIAITVVSVALVYWRFTMGMLMSSYEDRSLSLYTALERTLDPATFTDINGPDDMESELYQEAMSTMLQLKYSSGALYFYTAKINDEGEFVYVIDGLEPHLDFRHPNDPIDTEIIPQMQIALNNEIVMPENILHTDWGEIFIAYLPVHGPSGEVLGVVGIEFDASESYHTYIALQQTTIGILVVIVLLVILLAIRIFRRVSNPLYLDKNTVDAPTGLKNRNAYETDFKNLMARNEYHNVGMVVADINGLKEVNDRLGHISGDLYISLMAQVISAHKSKSMVAYRTGGDEFVVIVHQATEEILKDYSTLISEKASEQKPLPTMRCSIACGYALFDDTSDKGLEDTYRRADENMYADKKRLKEERQNRT